MAAPLALLDGRVLPLAEARISPLDRGFLFGDGIYEVVKLVGGQALFFDRHLARLSRNLAAARLPEPPDLLSGLDELLDRQGAVDGALYFQITRGVEERRSHKPPAAPRPTVFAFVQEIEFPPAIDELPGLAAITVRDERWARCDLKTTSAMATVLAKLAMADAGADEVLFVGPDGEVREGGNTSFFARDAEGWHVHPSGSNLLPGITHQVLAGAAAEAGLALVERPPLVTARSAWSEALLCGTTTGVRGVATLDGVGIGDGGVGAETRRWAALLAQLERRERSR